MGILIKQGIYDLWQPAPIPEWQGAGDPRAKIRIADLLRMSSGLRIDGTGTAGSCAPRTTTSGSITPTEPRTICCQ